jgi:predicted nucleotidyltransferase
MLGLVKDMSELAVILKDFRSDMKKLIENLAALNNHISKLERFTDSIVKLTIELEKANKNIQLLTDMLKEVK